MQYGDYEIQQVSSGFIVRDSKGNFIIETPTDDEAIEYIDELMEDQEIKRLEWDWYKKFDQYSKRLKDKFYIDGLICSYNEKALKSIAKSFEESNKVTVEICTEYIEGDYVFQVKDVYV